MGLNSGLAAIFHGSGACEVRRPTRFLLRLRAARPLHILDINLKAGNAGDEANHRKDHDQIVKSAPFLEQMLVVSLSRKQMDILLLPDLLNKAGFLEETVLHHISLAVNQSGVTGRVRGPSGHVVKEETLAESDGAPRLREPAPAAGGGRRHGGVVAPIQIVLWLLVRH